MHIVKNTSIKLIKLEKLKTTSVPQRYPLNIIEKSIGKALSIPLQTLRSPKLKNIKKILPFISTHNLNNINSFPIIKETSEISKMSKAQKKFSKNIVS